MRFVIAICAALLSAWLMLFIFGMGGATLVWRVLDHWFPTISAVTPNTNTNFQSWGGILLLPLAAAAGLVVGALIWDPKITRRTEAVTSVAVFILLIGVSGVNFWSEDTLINVNGQAAIDIVLSVASLVVVGLLIRWTPSLLTSTAMQRVAIFLVTTFGFALPLFYATSFLLQRFGYSSVPADIPDWIAFVGGVLGFVAAFVPSFKNRLQPPPSKEA
jgi:hypothetical protein